MKVCIFGQNYDVNLSTISWDALYDVFRIKEFIYFISNPAIQDALLPAKVVFIFFTIFFFCALMYFYTKSSYIHYHFFQGFGDAMPIQSSSVMATGSRWKKIVKKTSSGQEADYKLAIVEADDFFNQVLLEKGFKGESFEELIQAARKVILNTEDITAAHNLRNSVVYDPDYKLDSEDAKKVLLDYEDAIKTISAN